jgi:hypothetical protein
MNGKEKILDQLKNNHQQCQNLVLARGRELRQRSGEIELKAELVARVQRNKQFPSFPCIAGKN